MITHNVKVGLAVLLGIAILVFALRFVSGDKFKKETTYELEVVFDNVQGLGPGAKVWLSGVEIGKVQEVLLREDGKAVLKLFIAEEYQIRRDAEFTIKVGFLKDTILSIKNPDITPAKLTYYKPGDTILKTKTPATLDDLVVESHRALTQVNDMLVSVKEIVGDDTMKQNIFETVENVRLTTEEAHEFARIIKELGAYNQDNVNITVANIRDLTEKLNEVAGNVDALITNANDVAGDPVVKANIKDSIESLKATLDNLEEASASIKDLVTDEEINQDLRQTIKSTRHTMENADKALSGLSKTAKLINETEVKPSFEFRYDTGVEKYHADMNLRLIPPDSKTSYLIGFDDLGEDSNTNLMLGVRGSVPDLWYYFGIKKGKLGIGAEWKKLPWFYKAELNDPNDLRLNLRFGKRLFEDSFLMFGWESVFKRDSMSIGVLQQY